MLVGTSWHVFSVATEVHAELMGLPSPEFEAQKYCGAMIADILENGEAQFDVCVGHDSLGETSFEVGAIAGDAC